MAATRMDEVFGTRKVQFPKGIHERGSRYVVTGIREASRGGFYRAYGEIRRLV